MATKPVPGLSNLRLSVDQTKGLLDSIAALARREVLVGFPEDTTLRKEVAGEPEVTNAELGYTHDNGMPEHNIPARPFMIPGMLDATPKVLPVLEKVARRVLTRRDPEAIEQGWHQVGITVATALKTKVNEGIPPPLSERTLRERATRGLKGRKGAQQELARRAAGEMPSTQFAKPLIDTAQMRNAINYVIRDRKKRRL